MAKQFKVKYKERAVIERAYKRVIQKYGLVDFYTMKDSIRISAGSRVSLNKLYITVNAIYYFQFHDQFAWGTPVIKLWNGGQYATQPITQDVFTDPKVQNALSEIYGQYIAWLNDNFQSIRVSLPEDDLQIYVGYEFFGYEPGPNDKRNWGNAIAFERLA